MNVGWLSTFVHLKNKIPFFYKIPSLTYDIYAACEVSVYLIVFSLIFAITRPVEHMGPGGGGNDPPIFGPDRGKTFFFFLYTGINCFTFLRACTKLKNFILTK